MYKIFLIIYLSLTSLIAYSTSARYDSNIPASSSTNSINEELSDGKDKKIGIYEELGEIANIDTLFVDSLGNKKSIKSFMNNKATIISMNYYNCPGICSTQFASVASLVDLLDVDNKDFQVLTLSVEPKDTPELALKKKNTFFGNLKLKKDLPANQWKFLVSDKDSIKIFSDSIGYQYKKTVDKYGNVNYIHPGTLIVLSPNGKITRYIYGLNYSPFDVKMALIEAQEGRIGGIRVQALKYCFAYDAESKKYIFQWEKIVGGLIFFIVVSFFIYLVLTGRKEEDK